MDSTKGYYIPEGSYWPFVGSVALFIMLFGFASGLHGGVVGFSAMALGAAILLFMMFGWFGQVIKESESGTYNIQVDRSFRWGMGWFIFSEVMFLAAID